MKAISKRKIQMNFNSLEQIMVSCAEMLRPPERTTVSEAAAKYRIINSPGAYVGPWYNSTTPYMVEPMNVFASTDFTGLAFVGPAQCAKTDALIINAILYSVKIDPMDIMVVCPTSTAARDFSMRRIDRLHRYSPEMGKMLIPGAANDNKFDKLYTTGTMLTLSWPTPTELAGKPVGRVVITDRDRGVDDVDGEGEMFDLASKRTTTFGSNAMCLVESSPSREVKDIKWIPRTPHEAPPCEGIIGLYNRGDRRRWYWPCPHCNHYFEGRFEMLKYSKRREGMSNLDCAETVYMECPKCTEKLQPNDRFEMNLWGMWVKDGEAIDRQGRKFGTPIRTLIASFWLRGVAAAFVTWKKLVVMYMDACDDYERTGSEEALKKFYNNDLGEPYIPKSAVEIRLPEEIKARAERLPELEVPENVRFLVATADTQNYKWDVCVFGILPGQPFDTVIIERFEVKKSKRLDNDGDPEWVKPTTYMEDWDELYDQVMQREYPLSDGSGRLMSIKVLGCDMHGKKGVTTMAYNFYRKLRAEGRHLRFVLMRGDNTPSAPRARVTWPDSSQKDSKAGARGDIPVLQFNSNLLKDDLNGRLDCIEPGKGMYRTPDWLPTKYYAELCSEVRTDKGWEHNSNVRNEQWDLSYYAIGLCISKFVQVERIDWSNPPSWAAPWDRNDFIRLPSEEKPFGNNVKSAYDFAELGKSLT